MFGLMDQEKKIVFTKTICISATFFCCLGGMLSVGGCCKLAVTSGVKTVWKKFRELLPVLTSRYLSYKTRGYVYSSCVQSAMLCASETWPLTKTNLQPM